jgi:hypothetical protein
VGVAASSRVLVGLVVGLVVQGAIGACVVNLGGLSGGGSAKDATSPGVDATARSDGRPAVDGTSDVRPHLDGGLDATTPPDASPSLCDGDPIALLCDDFDDGPIGPPWKTSISGATLTISETESWSPPSSLFSQIPPDGGMTGVATASLIFNSPKGLGRVRNSYDLYIDELGHHSIAVGSVYALDGPLNYEVALFVHGTGELDIIEDGVLADGGEYTDKHEFLASVPVQAWIRVIMEVDFDAPATVNVTLETPPGSPAMPLLDAAITPTNASVTTQVYAGIEYVVLPEDTGWRLYVDNVLIEAP